MRALRAGGVGGEGVGGARAHLLRAHVKGQVAAVKDEDLSFVSPPAEHGAYAAYGPWRVEWWGEKMCGIRACVAAEGFERASGWRGSVNKSVSAHLNFKIESRHVPFLADFSRALTPVQAPSRKAVGYFISNNPIGKTKTKHFPTYKLLYRDERTQLREEFES